MGRLHGLGIERSIRELVVAPLEVAAALGPQGLHHLARLVQTLQPLAHRPEWDAVGLVLVLLPARAEPQEEPAARDDVDLRGHLRDHRRVAVVRGPRRRVKRRGRGLTVAPSREQYRPRHSSSTSRGRSTWCTTFASKTSSMSATGTSPCWRASSSRAAQGRSRSSSSYTAAPGAGATA